MAQAFQGESDLRPGEDRPRSRRSARVLGRLAVVATATTVWAGLLVPAPALASGGVRKVATYERTQSILARAANGNLLIEPAARRAYMAVVTVQTDLYAIDLDSMKRVGKISMPPLQVAQTLFAESEWLWTIDEKHRRLFAFQEGAPDPDTGLENYRLITVDLERFRVESVRRLWPLSDRIPLAIAYHAPTDRLHLLTRVKLEVDRRSAYFAEEWRPDGAMVWEYRVKSCYSALDFQHPPVVARSVLRPVVYLNCYGPQAVQGQVVRLHLGPNGTPTGEEEAFPAVPGDLSAAFDPGSDRMFFLTTNSGAGRGAWVFDGLRSTFLGVIASGDNRPGAFSYAMGLDPWTGRLYIQSPIGLIVADARRTPLPAGLLFREYAEFGVGKIQVDPVRHLLFVQDFRSANSVGHPTRYLLLEDRVPASSDPPPGDPDALTTDVPERPGVTGANYSGAARAFAARSLLTGGVHRGTWNIAVGPYFAPEGSPVWPTFQSIPVQTSNRDLFVARLGGVELAGDTADASAILGESDYGTTKDLRDHAADWPFVPTECHDGGSSPQSRTGVGDTTAVSCDAKARTVVASSRAFRLESEQMSAEALFVQTSVGLDPARGLVTRSAASVRNLALLGRVTIAELSVEAETWSRGRPGTAGGRFVRRLLGVRLDSDGDGEPEFTCDVCAPDEVRDAVNQTVGGQMRISFPDPDATYFPKGSKGGFQAVIEKERFSSLSSRALNDDDTTEVPGVEIVVFFDGRAGRTREVIQLAAVQAESHYGIFLLPGAAPPAPLPIEAPLPAPRPAVAPPPPPPAPAPAPQVSTVERVNRRIGLGLGVFLSDAREAVLLAGLWAFLALPGYLVWRRRLAWGRG